MDQLTQNVVSSGSTLAITLQDHSNESIGQALVLLVSARPELQELLLQLLQDPPGERYVGNIKSFWPDKKFGFIRCDSAAEQFGGADVYLAEQEIGNFTVGTQVSFTVMLNKDGKPQAKLLEAHDAGKIVVMASGAAPHYGSEYPEYEQQPPLKVRKTNGPSIVVKAGFGALGKGSGKPQKGKGKPAWDPGSESSWSGGYDKGGKGHDKGGKGYDKGSWQSGGSWSSSAKPLDENKRYSGTINKFFPDKKYGFIACEALQPQFGCDVYLSDQEILEFEIGSTVTFLVQLNKAGRPQARQLEAVGAPTISEDGETRYEGSIKSFFPEKHFGFIQCPAIEASSGGDVYLSDQEIREFTVGSSVHFLVAYNAKGKPQARDLQAA